MTKVEIYTTQTCPYCVRAKMLLDNKSQNFNEIDVGGNVELRQAMTDRAGGRTSVPQIFINDKHIGGCDDLYELDHQGGLDDLLAE